MTKAPQPGRVKTRLTPPLTAHEAAALNVCFLRDTAAAIANAGSRAQGVGVYTPVGFEIAYGDILPRDFFLIAQRGEGFGERLQNAVDDLLSVGFTACCLIDSDSPTVTADAYRTATNELLGDTDRIVIGPSADGGYYLIGMNRLHAHLFAEIDWSTDRVLAQTIDRAREVGVDPVMLPTFYDIDERVTLARLCDDLLDRGTSHAPATREFLSKLIQREGRERIRPQ